MLKRLSKFFGGLFRKKDNLKIGFYGPPNAGKTSLANLLCLDWTGEELGTVSEIPHETRQVQFREKVEIEHKGKKMLLKIIDTPGIATKIDYEDFLNYGVAKGEAKKWLDDMDAVIIVLDSTENPYSQVNLTIIGNLLARKIPVLIVANKIDLRKSNIKKIESAFPEYPVVGISAKKATNMSDFYDAIFKLTRKV